MQRFFLAILFLSSFLIMPSHAMSAETAISVSPAILESVVTLDKKNTTKVSIINTTNFPLPIKGQVSAFLTDEKISAKDEATFNASSWFALEPADFILQPMEKKDVIVTITPPNNAEPGGHYATIYFLPLIPAEVVAKESTVSLSRVGVLTFLIVPGDMNEELSIRKFEVPKFKTFAPFNIDITLYNEGNIHILPAGNIEVKDIRGKVVESLTLSPNIILPHTEKPHSLSWGKFTSFGRYTITLTLNYGANRNTLVSDSKHIWIIPWPIILGVFVLLTLLYKVFIVHIDRVKLAIKVLKGKDVQETQINSKNPSINPRNRSRINSSNTTSKRRNRS